MSIFLLRGSPCCCTAGRLSRVDIADMDAEVLSLAIDWMYGSVDEPLELHEAAHMMRAGDRLGILDLRDASARICCQWLEHLRSVCWLEHRQSVDVKEILRFATAIEASQVAWVSSCPVLLSNCYSMGKLGSVLACLGSGSSF